MKIRVTKIYWVILALVVATYISYMFISVAMNISGNANYQEIYPVTTVQLDEDVKVFTFEMQHKEAVESLAFYTNHKWVKVYADDVLIYEIPQEKHFFGNTSGSVYNLVDIPSDAKELTVEIQAIYPSGRNDSYNFLLGQPTTIYYDLLRRSLIGAIICVLDFSMGVYLVVSWMFVRNRTNIDHSMLYFGVFASIMGMWAFNETDIAMLLLTNRTLASYSGYTLLMLAPVPFIQFVNENFDLRKRKIGDVLCLISYAIFIICTTLHLTGILEFKQSVLLIHVELVMALLYLVYGLHVHADEAGFDRKLKFNLIGGITLALTIVLDFYAFYKTYASNDIIGQIGLMLYLFILTWDHTIESQSRLDEVRKTDFYRDLAITDILTQMYNRNAFNMWEERQETLKGLTIVTFDLNNLKECNDTLGHGAGDHYLIEAARIIKMAFANYGQCYRIGGDEFCVVLGHSRRNTVPQRIQKMLQLQAEFNEKDQEVEMAIAYGYASYDPYKDRSVEDIRSRADEMMYEKKREIKAAKATE